MGVVSIIGSLLAKAVEMLNTYDPLGLGGNIVGEFISDNLQEFVKRQREKGKTYAKFFRDNTVFFKNEKEKEEVLKFLGGINKDLNKKAAESGEVFEWLKNKKTDKVRIKILFSQMDAVQGLDEEAIKTELVNKSDTFNNGSEELQNLCVDLILAMRTYYCKEMLSDSDSAAVSLVSMVIGSATDDLKKLIVDVYGEIKDHIINSYGDSDKNRAFGTICSYASREIKLGTVECSNCGFSGDKLDKAIRSSKNGLLTCPDCGKLLNYKPASDEQLAAIYNDISDIKETSNEIKQDTSDIKEKVNDINNKLSEFIDLLTNDSYLPNKTPESDKHENKPKPEIKQPEKKEKIKPATINANVVVNCQCGAYVFVNKKDKLIYGKDGIILSNDTEASSGDCDKAVESGCASVIEIQNEKNNFDNTKNEFICGKLLCPFCREAISEKATILCEDGKIEVGNFKESKKPIDPNDLVGNFTLLNGVYQIELKRLSVDNNVLVVPENITEIHETSFPNGCNSMLKIVFLAEIKSLEAEGRNPPFFNVTDLEFVEFYNNTSEWVTDKKGKKSLFGEYTMSEIKGKIIYKKEGEINGVENR